MFGTAIEKVASAQLFCEKELDQLLPKNMTRTLTIQLQRSKYSKNIPATHYYILLFPTLAEEQQTKITVPEVSMFSSF